ncbi:MAG: type III pantothenate kinase, partial [Clostridia bacterium]|nr:type III pantothenate kinase [Clostridia bacterium]
RILAVNSFRAFLAAMTNLTVIPAPGYRFREIDLERSKPFFPVVGLLVGAILYAVGRYLPTMGLVLPTLLVILPILLTRGFPLDGLADTADAFMSSRDRERMLEIMRDSHIGTMGVFAMMSVLGTQFVTLAALSKYPTPIIVIDMGTGTTISLLNRQGAYEGCAIFPGVHIALAALSQHAAQLPEISIAAPPSCIGKNTIDSMRAGVAYGNAGMIEGIIARMEEETEPVSTIVATGGNAKFILKYCKRPIVYDADLLLEGLYLIYTKNEEKNCKK